MTEGKVRMIHPDQLMTAFESAAEDVKKSPDSDKARLAYHYLIGYCAVLVGCSLARMPRV